MDNGFAFSEVVRKLANLIRIGKVSEINGDEVKVHIGRVTTGWLPIISMAGKTSCWIPISEGEQVIVFSPYGESAQGFVLRSMYYDTYEIPENTGNIDIKTPSLIKIKGESGFDSEFAKDFCVKVGSATVSLSKNSITIRNGNNTISLSDNAITLSGGSSSIIIGSNILLSNGGSSINMSDSNISLSSGSISTSPPVCMCSGDI